MTCTRGRRAPGSRDLRTARPTFYCYAVPFVWVASPERQQAGVSLRVSDLARTPPASVDPRGTLAGITRRTVIELARQAGQPVQEGPLSPGDLGQPRRPPICHPSPLRPA